MAFRYLLRVGYPDDRGRDLPAGPPGSAGFARVYSDAQLTLACNEPAAWARIANDQGLLAGYMFHWDRFSRFSNLAAGETIEVDGDARAIFASLWGAFIAIVRTAKGVTVARDPSGLLPAYYVRSGDDWYFASDAPALVDAGLVTPAVDWERVARTLYANELPEEASSLRDIRQLLPGMAIDCNRGAASAKPIWSPWKHVTSAAPDREQLRRTILACLHAWGSRFERALIGVSGGLDSSIVAAGARKATRLSAVTISTRDAQGDEAVFAHALCDRLGISLAEEYYEHDRVDIEKSSYAHCPRPGGRAQLQAYDAAMLAVASRFDAEAFFTGVGGDNIFQFTKSARPLVDRYLAQGIRPALLSTLFDITRLTGAHAFRVMCEALKVPRTGRQKYFWQPDPRFLSRDAIVAAAASPLSHPWLEGPIDCLPGKAAHIAFLIRTQQYMDVHDRRLPTATLHPLLSMPIIEACLAMPSWTACEGGVDRAYARNAFAGDLPPEVLNRSVKNGPDGFALAIIRRHLGRIRERLLDGELAHRGIVDRPSLEAALREQELARADDYPRLLLLLDTEAWAEGWSGR